MLAGLALLLAGAAAVEIWNTGRRGVAPAAIGRGARARRSSAIPAYLTLQAARLPRINQVTTDFKIAAAYMISSRAREARGAWTPPSPGPEVEAAQRAAYPAHPADAGRSRARSGLSDVAAHRQGPRLAHRRRRRRRTCAARRRRISTPPTARCSSASSPTSPFASARRGRRRRSTSAPPRASAATISAPTRGARGASSTPCSSRWRRGSAHVLRAAGERLERRPRLRRFQRPREGDELLLHVRVERLRVAAHQPARREQRRAGLGRQRLGLCRARAPSSASAATIALTRPISRARAASMASPSSSSSAATARAEAARRQQRRARLRHEAEIDERHRRSARSARRRRDRNAGTSSCRCRPPAPRPPRPAACRTAPACG